MDQTLVSNENVDPQKQRSRLQWLGVFWSLLGVVAIATSVVATVATMLVFGVLLIMAGIAQFADAVTHSSSDRVWQFVTAVLYSLVGLLLLIDPLEGAIGLTLLIALLFLLRGVIQLATAASGRRWGRTPGWRIVAGVLNLLLAALIIAAWPEIGSWAIGMFVGIELLLGGLTLLLTPDVVIDRGQG